MLLLGTASVGLVLKLTFTINVNDLLKRRDARRRSKLQNSCTHLIIEPAGNGNIGVEECFISPPGTIQYFCRKCQRVSFDPSNEFRSQFSYYVANVDKYLEAEKKFQSMLKRFGYL